MQAVGDEELGPEVLQDSSKKQEAAYEESFLADRKARALQQAQLGRFAAAALQAREEKRSLQKGLQSQNAQLEHLVDVMSQHAA